jgi:hypothetical protein
MKKFFIVLLIAAIGAGVYFYFSNKPRTSKSTSKEFIVGKWRLDSITFKKDTSFVGRLFSHLFDSSRNKYEIEFTKDGSIFKMDNGIIQDTSHYYFANENTLLITDQDDSGKEKWRMSKMDSSTMTATDDDSTVFFLRRSL